MSRWWRRVPVPLWLACGLVLTDRLVGIARTLGSTNRELMYGTAWGARLGIVSSGVAVVTGVLLLVALLWLARRLTGAAAVGAKLAVAGQCLRIAGVLGSIVYYIHVSLHPMDVRGTAFYAVQIALQVEAVVIAVGLGIAARRWWAIVLGAGAALLATPIWPLAKLYYSLVSSVRGSLLVMHGLALAWYGAVLALAVLAFRGAADDGDDTGGVTGLRRIAFALRGRVVAALILACIGLLFVGPNDERRMMELYDVVELAAVAIEAALLVVLALGGLRAVRGRGELPAWPMTISAAAALWVGGASLQTLGSLYLRLVRPPASSYGAPGVDLFQHVSATTTGLVAAGAVAGVLIAVAIAARRRGLDALHQRLVVRTGWFVGLSLAAIAITYWLGAPFEQTLLAALVRIGANVLAIAGLWIAASACGDAARALASEPGLPAARVVRS